MNIQRAKEILNSPNNIEVLYQGTPIWIENVNENNFTANVKSLSNSQRLEVNVGDLRETGKFMEM